MSSKFIDALNKAQKFADGEQARQDALAGLDEAQKELDALRAKLMGNSGKYTGNSLAGAANWEPLPE